MIMIYVLTFVQDTNQKKVEDLIYSDVTLVSDDWNIQEDNLSFINSLMIFKCNQCEYEFKPVGDLNTLRKWRHGNYKIHYFKLQLMWKEFKN